MTAASVYHQVLGIPGIDKIFYIGANGKIGNAVCRLLAEKNVKICIFSKYEGIVHPNITYTQDMSDIQSFKFTLIGKILKPNIYKRAFGGFDAGEPRYLLDYTVPFMPLNLSKNIKHVQIGVLRVANPKFLQGAYDFCFGLEEGHIYPCHAGCIINFTEKRGTDETGEIVLNEVVPAWAKAIKNGLQNRRLVIE